MMCGSDNDWDYLLLMDSNPCLKFMKSRKRWMHQLLESRTSQNEHINVSLYIFDTAKDYIQGYSNFRKRIETKEKLTVAPR
jgi:hypothetical protein